MKISKERIKQLIKENIAEKKKPLNETYKLTFQDKQDLEKEIRNEYEKYLKKAKKDKEQDQIGKRVLAYAKDNFSKEDYEVLLNSFGGMELKPIMRYNEFYSKNKDYITKDFINYKSKNAMTDFNYPMKPVSGNIDEYYKSLSNEEIASIKKFLRIVGIRIASGAGESIDRREVRNAFFKTPTPFQKMFSEKPNPYLWRGDYAHPSEEDYDKEDKEYLSMQSFSTYKSVAQMFGYAFSAVNIKSYGGSFSVPKFLEYGESKILGSSGFPDDEGEVMFFDVIYK